MDFGTAISTMSSQSSSESFADVLTFFWGFLRGMPISGDDAVTEAFGGEVLEAAMVVSEIITASLELDSQWSELVLALPIDLILEFFV